VPFYTPTRVLALMPPPAISGRSIGLRAAAPPSPRKRKVRGDTAAARQRASAAATIAEGGDNMFTRSIADFRPNGKFVLNV
jgi:hypothetical protein